MVLNEGPELVSKAAQDSLNHEVNRHAVGHTMPHWWFIIIFYLSMKDERPTTRPNSQTTEQQDGLLVKGRAVVWQPSVRHFLCVASLLS